VFGGVMVMNPQFRTIWSSRLRYPKTWRAMQIFRDRAKGEAFNYYLPVLKVDARHLFIVFFRNQSDSRLMKPLATLLLDDAGRVMANDELLEKAYITYNLAIMTTSPAQTQLSAMRSSGQTLLKRHLPTALAKLDTNRLRFRELALGAQLDQALTQLAAFTAAVEEADRFLNAREGYLRAIGYGLGSEFLYSDAERMRQLSVAFVQKMRAEFDQPILELSLVAAFLQRQVETNPQGWQDRGQLQFALAFLAEARNALQTFYVFEREARVPEEIWQSYHDKLAALKAKGIQVYEN
jgi:hypothetical protein